MLRSHPQEDCVQERVGGSVDRWMEGWLDGWMDEWVVEKWMSEQVEEWMNG